MRKRAIKTSHFEPQSINTLAKVLLISSDIFFSWIENITTVWLTVSGLQTKTFFFANSADLDETAHNEPSQLELHCLPFCSDF